MNQEINKNNTLMLKKKIN